MILIGLFIASVCVYPEQTGKVVLGIFVIAFIIIIYLIIYNTVDDIINTGNKDEGDIWY